ncbi:hypothetical protein BC831DRAFT_451051 [Entophlyctis helioformis]|nr:hypothetical protein BC831DRAFT_451051 [Entophlyctis helioformis]
MPQARPWILRRVHERGLSPSELVMLDEELPWPTFRIPNRNLDLIPEEALGLGPHASPASIAAAAAAVAASGGGVLTAETCRVRVYPRVIKNRSKINHLEMKLEIDMLRQFTGLTVAQRDALLRIIDKNARIRQSAGLASGVFEKIQDDLYDYAFRRRHSGSSSRRRTHSAQSPTTMATETSGGGGGGEGSQNGRSTLGSAGARTAPRSASAGKGGATSSIPGLHVTTSGSVASSRTKLRQDSAGKTSGGGGGGYDSDPGPVTVHQVRSDAWLNEDDIGGRYFSDDVLGEDESDGSSESGFNDGKDREDGSGSGSASRSGGSRSGGSGSGSESGGGVGYKSSNSTSDMTDDLADLEFPIEDYELKSKPQKSGGDDFDSDEERGSPFDRRKRRDDDGLETNLRQKYSHLIDLRKRGATAGQRAATKQDLEHEAMMEMKSVSADLQRWVTDVLDNSINLDPEILAEVNKMEIAANERPKTGAAGSAPGGGPAPSGGGAGGGSGAPGQPARPTQKDLSVLERVDISGFDVLLNACKPSILEAKPPVRLNVVHEINPPDALVSTLQKNLGMNLDDKKDGKDGAGKSKKVLPEVDSSFTYRKKVRRQRPRYGAWYVPSRLWNEYMNTHGEDAVKKKADESKNHRFGGIVQEKLDEINRKREMDYDHFLKELEHGNAAGGDGGNGPASANKNSRGGGDKRGGVAGVSSAAAGGGAGAGAGGLNRGSRGSTSVNVSGNPSGPSGAATGSGGGAPAASGASRPPTRPDARISTQSGRIKSRK